MSASYHNHYKPISTPVFGIALAIDKTHSALAESLKGDVIHFQDGCYRLLLEDSDPMTILSLLKNFNAPICVFEMRRRNTHGLTGNDRFELIKKYSAAEFETRTPQTFETGQEPREFCLTLTTEAGYAQTPLSGFRDKWLKYRFFSRGRKFAHDFSPRRAWFRASESFLAKTNLASRNDFTVLTGQAESLLHKIDSLDNRMMS